MRKIDENVANIETKEEKNININNDVKLNEPVSFEQFMERLENRIRFMLHMVPPSSTETNNNTFSALVEKWGSDNFGPIELTRWKSMQSRNSEKKWGGKASVLKAQRKLKKTKSGNLNYKGSSLISVEDTIAMDMSLDGKLF